MKSHYTLLTLFILLLILSCKPSKEYIAEDKSYEPLADTAPTSLRAYEQAHRTADFYDYECVSFELILVFGDKTRFRGKIYSMTDSRSIRVDYANGKKLLFHEEQVYTADEPNQLEKDRWDLFTWQYFFMAPYKILDPGTKWQDLTPDTIAGQVYERQMLTFEDGIGDAPRDWYILHPDPETQLLTHMGYIVTARGQSIEEAEKNAHAISYSDYREVQGVPISHYWTFYDYSREDGLGKELGYAKVLNVRFDEAKETFDPSSNILFVPYGNQ